MKQKFSILGSGFGLYGYLPALLNCKQTVILPKRYLQPLLLRPYLVEFKEQIIWVERELDLFKANCLILALPPKLQTNWLSHPLVKGKNLLLEKPLATTPETAQLLLQGLLTSSSHFRIGYLFRYTAWGKRLLACNFIQTRALKIHWTFCAHHFKYQLNNWKRFHSQGGGVIRFYGIHLLALLSEMGYSTVVYSIIKGQTKDEPKIWSAELSGNDLQNVSIYLDSNSKEESFLIELITDGAKEQIINLQEPFAAEQVLFEDRRILPLVQLVKTLRQKKENKNYVWYFKTLKLWQAVEANTEFIGV